MCEVTPGEISNEEWWLRKLIEGIETNISTETKWIEYLRKSNSDPKEVDSEKLISDMENNILKEKKQIEETKEKVLKLYEERQDRSL